MIGIVGTILLIHAFVTICLYYFLASWVSQYWQVVKVASHFLGLLVSSSSSHSSMDHVSVTNAKSSVLTIFLANLFSGALLFVAGAIGFMLVTYTDIKKAFALVLLLLLLPTSSKLIICDHHIFATASNTTGISK